MFVCFLNDLTQSKVVSLFIFLSGIDLDTFLILFLS